ncbi:SDR family oxidoreductase [Nocardioides bigeumensis]|uniref:SDR family oxidoreductase n=1 Tax=Nocardioides bigeumensis TaxID=433657 RepID=A0ABN2YAS8_9ACTN
MARAVTSHLVTGAGSGVGAAIARRLHERGDHLVLVARSDARAEELGAAYPGSDLVVADLADVEGLDAALTAADLPDELDSLMQIAGALELGAVGEASLADWREQLDVNLVAPAVLTRHCLPALRAARGTIVFANSSAGLYSSPTWGAYAATKYGLRALADAVRAEEIENGVRVTSVFLSRTATPMQEKVHEQEGRVYDESKWISPETVADTVMTVLDLPRDATIPEVSVRPVVPRPT